MITIVGAGMGGTLLGIVLSQHGIPFTILDADPSLNARHQGGMLNINEDTGQLALKAAGLFDAFMSRVLAGGDAFRLLDKNQTLLLAQDGDGSRPEIARGALRELLVEALPAGTIRWNTRVTAVTRVAGGFELQLADGGVHHTEILIGADGAWSKVRPLLTMERPSYTGVTFTELRYLEANTQYPEAFRIVGDGLMFALSDERGFLGHREADNELCVYVALKVPENWHHQELTRAGLAAEFAGWHPDFLAMLAKGDGELTARPIYAIPTGHYWPRTPGVTLVGDAAHLMSPFGGEGVNLAMADAADLGLAIAEAKGDFDAAFAAYEAKMAARTTPVAEQTAANLKMTFAKDTPREVLEFFSSLAGSE